MPGPGRRFLKGVSGNPLGRPRMPAAVKEAKEYASSVSREVVTALHQITQQRRYRLSDRLRAAELVLKTAGAFDEVPVAGLGQGMGLYAGGDSARGTGGGR